MGCYRGNGGIKAEYNLESCYHWHENSAQYSNTQTKEETLGHQVLVVLSGEAGQQKAQDGDRRTRHQEWRWPKHIK